MGLKFFRAAPRQRLSFPVAATERIAVLSEAFELEKNARQFHANDAGSIRQYAPQGLVATYEDALAVGPLELDNALVILTPAGYPPLSTQDQDLLWRTFRVPVYEHLQAEDGTVIAMECEVHDGLHVVKGTAAVPEGLRGQVTNNHCECGRETPRLRNLSFGRSSRPSPAGSGQLVPSTPFGD